MGAYASHLRSEVQVKAGNFSASKITGEVAPKDELHTANIDLAIGGDA